MRYKISCAILAGGRSSRMGKDKALLEVNGKKLVQRVHEKVKNLFAETIVIANKPDALTFLDIPIFSDLIANLGPLGGIYTALKHSSFPQCLVIACDLPFIPEELIRSLCDDAGGYDILSIDFGRGVEPLCAVYHQDCIKMIENQIESKNYKVSDLFDHVTVRIQQVPKGHSDSFYGFFNINTPEDVKEAEMIMKNDEDGR